MNYIDLFAGAGGLSEGFIRAGFNPVAHVEMDEAACYTLKTRAARHYLKEENKFSLYLSYLKGEISRDYLYEYIPKDLLESVINLPIGADKNPKIYRLLDEASEKKTVDVIIGGPPCQAYSLAGRARDENRMKGDPRNYLYVSYARFLERYQPKLFVFENVTGLKSAGKGVYLENMKRLFSKKGYEMRLFTVDSGRFGVLQNRKRVIIIGWKSELAIKVPDLELIDVSATCKVRAIFEDLPQIQANGGKDKHLTYTIKTANEYLIQSGIRNGIDFLTQHVSRPHSEQDKEIYRIAVERWNTDNERLKYNDLPERLKTHQNRDSFIDRFKVVAADLDRSQTVVAHISKDGHYYIHPDISQNRSITIREAARLQSFPDDYYFEGIKETGSRTAAFRQIGNAVPPLMAFKIAQQIKNLLA